MGSEASPSVAKKTTRKRLQFLRGVVTPWQAEVGEPVEDTDAFVRGRTLGMPRFGNGRSPKNEKKQTNKQTKHDRACLATDRLAAECAVRSFLRSRLGFHRLVFGLHYPPTRSDTRPRLPKENSNNNNNKKLGTQTRYGIAGASAAPVVDRRAGNGRHTFIDTPRWSSKNKTLRSVVRSWRSAISATVDPAPPGVTKPGFKKQKKPANHRVPMGHRRPPRNGFSPLGPAFSMVDSHLARLVST